MARPALLKDLAPKLLLLVVVVLTALFLFTGVVIVIRKVLGLF